MKLENGTLQKLEIEYNGIRRLTQYSKKTGSPQKLVMEYCGIHRVT